MTQPGRLHVDENFVPIGAAMPTSSKSDPRQSACSASTFVFGLLTVGVTWERRPRFSVIRCYDWRQLKLLAALTRAFCYQREVVAS